MKLKPSDLKNRIVTLNPAVTTSLILAAMTLTTSAGLIARYFLRM